MKKMPFQSGSLELGAELFNRGLYFEAHEAWETLWHHLKQIEGADSAPARKVQSWILLAGVGVHLKKGQLSPAGRLFQRYLDLSGEGGGFQGPLQGLAAKLQAVEEGSHSAEELFEIFSKLQATMEAP
jgi:hypothetical protein